MVPVGPVPEPATDEARRSDVDEWGRSEHIRSIARRLYDPMYRYWFRVEWQGLEKIPTTGGALLIANHAGAIPSDAPGHHARHRAGAGPPRIWARRLLLPHDASRRHDLVPHRRRARSSRQRLSIAARPAQLALVFPEGTKATSKTYADRYRLRRFGRGGFVEIAMRSGVPVIPIAVIGAEESMPIVFRIGGLAKALKLPYFPVTANALLMGPLGYAVYFPAKMKFRVLDPINFDVEPGLERYSRSRVMDEAETIRANAPGSHLGHAAPAPQRLVRVT